MVASSQDTVSADHGISARCALVDESPCLWHQQGLEGLLFGVHSPRADSPYDRILVAVMTLVVALGRFLVDVLVVAYYAYALLPFHEADGIVRGLRSPIMEIRGVLLRFAMRISTCRRANVTSERCACQSTWVLSAGSVGSEPIECMLCGDPTGGGRELSLLSHNPYFADVELGFLAHFDSPITPLTVSTPGRQ